MLFTHAIANYPVAVSKHKGWYWKVLLMKPGQPSQRAAQQPALVRLLCGLC